MHQTPTQPVIGISQTIENQTFVIENELLVDDFPLRDERAEDFRDLVEFFIAPFAQFLHVLCIQSDAQSLVSRLTPSPRDSQIYRFTERPIDDPVIGEMFLNNLSHNFWFIHQRFRGEP